METAKKIQTISASQISDLVKKQYTSLMAGFYEMQSSFLSSNYKRYDGIETANIILCFSRNINLEILRQREKDLNFNISLENFWTNFNAVTKPSEKISTVVSLTGIPKETVRRKIKQLFERGFLINSKVSRGYSWNLLLKERSAYFLIINDEIKTLSNFGYKLSLNLNLNLSMKIIEQEIKSQFSFYWYHFLSCQLEWLKMWQLKLKDNDLLLIILQTIIPTLQYADKNIGNISLDNIFKIIGKTNIKYNFSKTSVSATAVADVTGIPRATCIRKLEKLVSLGFLLREIKSRRYYVNQSFDDRTKNIITKENVNFTIETFSQYLSIILNSLALNTK